MGARGPQPQFITEGRLKYLREAADGGTLAEIGARMGVRREMVSARLSEVYKCLRLNYLPREEKRQAAIDTARTMGLIK
jgi:DNA-binding NarL/FixJ family response regulator